MGGVPFGTESHFISEDPAQDGINYYSYAGNSPLCSTDPTGLDGVMESYTYQQTTKNSKYAHSGGPGPSGGETPTVPGHLEPKYGPWQYDGPNLKSRTVTWSFVPDPQPKAVEAPKEEPAPDAKGKAPSPVTPTSKPGEKPDSVVGGTPSGNGTWEKSHGFLENFGTTDKPYLHAGEDWIYLVNGENKTEGAPVYSLYKGVVQEAVTGQKKTDSKLGNLVRILTEDGGQYNTFHYMDTVVTMGQKIAPGDLLGHAGNTGTDSIGAHLHDELRYATKPKNIEESNILSRYDQFYVDPKDY